MSARPAFDFLALCASRGIDPDTIPNSDGMRSEASKFTAGAANLVSIAYKIGAASRGNELDAVGREIYTAHGVGALSDAEVDLLETARQRRRAEQKVRRQWWERIYGSPPKAPRDRHQARTRRRGLVRLGWLPPTVANSLTPGEEAVAAIYAEDFRRKGYCDDTKSQLAERAGVVERVVQRAQRSLLADERITITRRPHRRQRHDSTIVVIVDPAWRLWLRHRRVPQRSPMGVGDCKGERQVDLHLLQNIKQAVVRADRPQVALQGESRAGLEASRGEGGCGRRPQDRDAAGGPGPSGALRVAGRGDCGISPSAMKIET